MTDFPPPTRNITRIGILFEGGLGIAALAIGLFIGYSPAESIELRWDAVPSHLAAIGWGAVAAMPMLAALIVFTLTPLPFLNRLESLVRVAVASLFRDEPISGLAMVSFMAGVGEELMFRGLIQGALVHWLPNGTGPWIAILCASVLFGLAHFLSITYAIFATVVGAYLGWLYWSTDELLIPIVAHGLYDFIAIVYFAKLTPRQDATEERPSDTETDDQ